MCWASVQETGSTQYLYVKDSDEELRDWVAKVVLADATSVKADLDDEYKDGRKGQDRVDR